MNCPRCQSTEVGVTDTRVADEGATLRRRRRCQACGHVWTTYEVSKVDYQDLRSARRLTARAEQLRQLLNAVLGPAEEEA